MKGSDIFCLLYLLILVSAFFFFEKPNIREVYRVQFAVNPEKLSHCILIFAMFVPQKLPIEMLLPGT
jgi:hypothetical protein